MATFIRHKVKYCVLSPLIIQLIRRNQSLPGRLCSSPPLILSRLFCKTRSLQIEDSTCIAEVSSRYQERPWDYMESEEYLERYGTSPVWAGYRRNHKGCIPPQKTRKTCIRGGKTCGNPCPICRDSNVVIHRQNVKLLQQFVSPYTGEVYDPTKTGVCMKQQKKLNEAIKTARDHGLLSFQIPYVEFVGEDFSNSHDAVQTTPFPPSLSSGDAWYKWYSEIMPDEREVAKVKKAYKAYLK